MTTDITPASPGEVAVYAPYYAVGRRPLLPLAVGLYKQKNFEGQRDIEGDASVPFVATWPSLPLPSDLTVCQVQFKQDAELTYEMSLSNFEFIDYLIDVVGIIKRGQSPDFSTAFYKKLMKRDS